MFDNIEAFYRQNHFRLIEDKSEGSLRPGKSFVKDVENCISKFVSYYVSSGQETINETRLLEAIGQVDTNTKSQNLRVMREFGFLYELETPESDGAKYKFTEYFHNFVAAGDEPRKVIKEKFSNISCLNDFTMYLNLLLCTLREAYLYGQVMLFPDSDEKFKTAVPSLESRNAYRKRIFEVYGYSGRDKQITDDVYSPNLSYMSRAELENLGLLIMTTKKIDNMNNLVLTKEGYELLEHIDENLSKEDVDSEADSDELEEILKHNLFGIHIKNKNNALSDTMPHICIGWSEMGDLSVVTDRDSMGELYDQHYQKSNRGRGQDIGQVWRFYNEMKIGDYVIFAESSEFHIGRIDSDYYFDGSDNPEQDPDYTNNRKVTWLKTHLSRSMLSTDMHRSLATAMSVWSLNDFKSAVVDILNGTYVKDDPSEDTQESLEYKTGIDCGYDRNRIVFGAPGTGKSFRLKDESEKLVSSFGAVVERVTFHPDYTYSQFVGAYKPIMDDDGKTIKYKFTPGPFMRVFVNAMKNVKELNPRPFILIIEEINRAKVAAVFGDVFQLLDRTSDGVSEYEIQTSEDLRKYLAEELEIDEKQCQGIRIPDNMYIWSTMNSADQGVFPMDTAFKRRWSFEYLGINDGESKIAGRAKFAVKGMDIPVEWNKLRKAINAKMSSQEYHINEDKLMGPFFLAMNLLDSDENGNLKDEKAFIKAFKSKVLMYLYEDAVKQRKHDFFENCDTSKYSAICDAFDEKGIAIFGSSFVSDYYE